MKKIMFALALAAALSACVFGHERNALIPAQEAGAGNSSRSLPGLQQVALRPAPPLRASQPVGLAPCQPGHFVIRDCWRQGDAHFVFQQGAPDGPASALTPPADIEGR